MKQLPIKDMNPDIQLAKFLGGFSLCLGALELFYGRKIKKALGLPVPSALIRAAGAREMLSGFIVLAHPDNVSPIALRIAGDAMDLAILGAALLPTNRKRQAATLATAAVIGVTLLDFAAAAALRQRDSQSLATARRTRVKQIATTA